MNRWVLAAAVLVALASPQRARACTSCACGVPVLSSAGDELPIGDVLRASFGVRSAALDVEGDRIVDLRAVAGVSATAMAGIIVSAEVPWAVRLFSEQGVVSGASTGLGDVAIGASALVWRDRLVRPRELLVARAGLSSSTLSPFAIDAVSNVAGGNSALPASLQPGAQAVAAALGTSWTHLAPQSQFTLSVVGGLPLWSWGSSQPGASLRTAATLQLNPLYELGLRLGLEGRGQLADTLDSKPHEGTGRVGILASAGVVWSLTPEVVVAVSGAVPVASTSPEVRDGAATSMTLALDL